MREAFTISGEVELFPQQGGWHYVRVPIDVTDAWSSMAERGLIAVHARLGGTTWDTSLLPMGDGTHVVALSAKVRRAAGVRLGDTVTISVALRER